MYGNLNKVNEGLYQADFCVFNVHISNHLGHLISLRNIWSALKHVSRILGLCNCEGVSCIPNEIGDPVITDDTNGLFSLKVLLTTSAEDGHNNSSCNINGLDIISLCFISSSVILSSWFLSEDVYIILSLYLGAILVRGS